MDDKYWITKTKFDKEFSTLFALKSLLNFNDDLNPYVISRQILEKNEEGTHFEDLLMYDVLSIVNIDNNGNPIFSFYDFIDDKYLNNNSKKQLKYLTYRIKILL